MSKKHNYFGNDIFCDVNVDKMNVAETDLLIREEAKFLAQEYLIKEKSSIINPADSFSSKLDKLEESSLLNIEEIKKNVDSWKENRDVLSRIEEKLLMVDEEIKKMKNSQYDSLTGEIAPISSSNDDVISEIKKTLQENNENIKSAFENIADKISLAINNNNNNNSSQKNNNDIGLEQINFDDQIIENETDGIVIKNLDVSNTNDSDECLCANSTIECQKIDNNNEISSLNWDEINVNPLSNQSLKQHFNKYDDGDDVYHNLSTIELEELKRKQLTLLSEQEKINTEIAIIKDSINDFITTSEFSNKNILEHTIDNAKQIYSDVSEVKVQYSNLEDEINKIYTTWLENNKLLSNLENLLFELNNKNDELISSKSTMDDDIFDKTINHEKCINDLSVQSLHIKDSLEDLNRRLTMVETLASNGGQNSIDGIFKKVDDLVEKIDDIETGRSFYNNNFLQNTIKNISKTVVEEELDKRNLLNADSILTREKVIDEVMESDIFNYSLEKKITQVFMDEKLNKRLTDDERNEMVNYAIHSDKFKNIIASEVNYISNDIKLEMNDRFNRIKDDLHGYNVANANRFSGIENMINSNDSLIQRHEIVEMIFASKELENIINDKLIYVVNDKLDELKSSVMEIEKKIISSIKWYLDEEVQENIKKEIIESKEVRQKIKNDALNAIYNEIQERDKVFDIQKNEFLKSYESLLENNRILENLEQLVLRQVDEMEGLKKDKDNSLELVIEKINTQKVEINHLKEKINQLSGKEIFHNIQVTHQNNNVSNEKEVFDNIKGITSSLVRDEIKKLNLINDEDYSPKSLSNDGGDVENEFFKNRIKDILMRLEQDYDPIVSIDEKVPLTNVLKNNFDDLKIDINKLTENEPKENLDEDFGWFYEKEFENHKEEKNNDANELLTKTGELDKDVIDEILGKK